MVRAPLIMPSPDTEKATLLTWGLGKIRAAETGNILAAAGGDHFEECPYEQQGVFLLDSSEQNNNSLVDLTVGQFRLCLGSEREVRCACAEKGKNTQERTSLDGCQSKETHCICSKWVIGLEEHRFKCQALELLQSRSERQVRKHAWRKPRFDTG